MCYSSLTHSIPLDLSRYSITYLTYDILYQISFLYVLCVDVDMHLAVKLPIKLSQVKVCTLQYELVY